MGQAKPVLKGIGLEYVQIDDSKLYETPIFRELLGDDRFPTVRRILTSHKPSVPPVIAPVASMAPVTPVRPIEVNEASKADDDTVVITLAKAKGNAA